MLADGISNEIEPSLEFTERHGTRPTKYAMIYANPYTFCMKNGGFPLPSILLGNQGAKMLGLGR